MNFEDAYRKLREGTATDEEAAFVARELENIRRISAVLDDPALSDPGISRAEVDTVQKARKAFNRKTLLRTVLITLGSLLAVAAVVCAILFIPSNISASRKLKITKAQAVEAAYACLAEQVGEEGARSFMWIMPTVTCATSAASLTRSMSTRSSSKTRTAENMRSKSTATPAIR